MQKLDYADYQVLRQGARVIEADGHGEKVLLLPNGNFLKLFRRKRVFTSAALFPYAQRFARNTEALRKRDIPCPRILDTWRVAEIERDVVHYAPLPGDTLRHLITGAVPPPPALLTQFATFVAGLHEQGIYFRSLHLGNVVMTPDNQLGLIDIADLRAYPWALRRSLCLRNFQHMLRYEEDRDWLMQEGGAPFFQAYAEHAPLEWQVEQLARRLA
ncbi:toluene tolerance protein [Pseudomonas putida]